MPVWVISDDRQRAWYQKGHSGRLLEMLPDDTRIPDVLDIADEQMALAGITSAIPVDEVIDAMRRIGADMSDTLKETARGGLATTRTALEVKNRLKM